MCMSSDAFLYRICSWRFAWSTSRWLKRTAQLNVPYRFCHISTAAVPSVKPVYFSMSPVHLPARFNAPDKLYHGAHQPTRSSWINQTLVIERWEMPEEAFSLWGVRSSSITHARTHAAQQCACAAWDVRRLHTLTEADASVRVWKQGRRTGS